MARRSPEGAAIASPLADAAWRAVFHPRKMLFAVCLVAAPLIAPSPETQTPDSLQVSLVSFAFPSTIAQGEWLETKFYVLAL